MGRMRKEGDLGGKVRFEFEVGLVDVGAEPEKSAEADQEDQLDYQMELQ